MIETTLRKVGKRGTFYFENSLYTCPGQFASIFGDWVSVERSPMDDRLLLYAVGSAIRELIGHADRAELAVN